VDCKDFVLPMTTPLTYGDESTCEMKQSFCENEQIELLQSVGPVSSTQPNPTHRKVKILDPQTNPTHNPTEHIQPTANLQHKEDSFRHIISWKHYDCQ